MQRSRQVFGRRGSSFPEVGSRFHDRYQLESQLGSGGGSVVFKALDTRLSRYVALKILSPTELGSEGIARFKREALSNARLSHPRIVTVYDFDEADGLPYLVLELVKGGDLWSLLYEQNVSLSLEEGIELGIKLLDGLAYAHAQNVIHRDLKPENILLVENTLSPKITDFGLAYIRGQKRITQDNVISGSAYYMAPEVAEGKTSDHRVDLYALGVILYELAVGRLPFYSENALAVISMHRHDAPPLPSEINPLISPTLESIVLKLLAKNPDDRFATAEEAQEALLKLSDSQLAVPLDSPQSILDRLERIRPAGWDGEVTALRESWQQIQVGSIDAKPIAVISGEAGSGKSLLAHELSSKAILSGAIVLQGQCNLLSTSIPYRPIIEMLQDYLRDHTPIIHPSVATDLAKLVPDVADYYDLEELPPLTPEAEQLRLFSHITQFLIQIAEQQPLLLVMEDLHCTDASTLSLLRYICRQVAGYHIFILGTYRPSELDHHHPLEALIRELAGQNLLVQVKLHRLSREDVRVMAESIFGEKINPALSTAIFEQSQGNLFFVKELMKSLIADGHVYWQNDHWQVGRLDEIPLPGSIRSMLRQQLSQLDETCHNILTTAAVIGSEFHFRTLAAVADIDEEALSDAIEQAMKRRLIFEKKGVREESYIFANLALQQTLLEELNPRRLARLHLKIAKTIESLYQHRIDEQIETIARHYCLGARTDEDISTAIHYLERAADRASRVFALTNAVELYTTALDLAQDDLSAERESRILRLREHRGAVYHHLGDFNAAAADFEWVLKSPEVAQNPSRKRGVLLQLGQGYRRGEDFTEAIRTLSDAVDISRGMDDERLLADALYYLGATYWSLGKITQAIAHQSEGYEIVRRLGLEDEVAMKVIHGLAECYGRRGDYPKLFALAEESLSLARRLGEIEYIAENLAIIATAEAWRGNYARAIAVSEELMNQCQSAGLFWHQMVGKVFYGGAVAGTGDYDHALKILHESLDVTLERYRGFLITMTLIHLGRCYLDIEALDRAEEMLTMALDRAERHRLNWSDALTKAYWAMAQIRQGNLEVRAMLEDALERAHTDGDTVYLPAVYQALGELELGRGDYAAALKHAEEMREMAVLFDQPPIIAKADRLRARAYLAMEKPQEARNILEAAVEAAMGIQSPRLQWELHQTLADIYEVIDDTSKAISSQRRVRQLVRQISSNLSDANLQRGVEAYLPALLETRTTATLLRFLVISDSFGTMVREGLKLYRDEISRCNAILLLGDLPSQAYPSLREDFALDLPAYVVLGNHDHTNWQSWLPRYKFQHVHTSLASLRAKGKDITIGGFSGAEAYNPGEEWHWEDRDAEREIRNLPACDILLTHTAGSPPPNYPADPNHRGLAPIQRYIDEHQPYVALHGHFHENYHLQRGRTHIIGCFGAMLLECIITADGWEVDIQPINQHIW